MAIYKIGEQVFFKGNSENEHGVCTLLSLNSDEEVVLSSNATDFVCMLEDIMPLSNVQCCPHCGSYEIELPVYMNPNTNNQGYDNIEMLNAICRTCYMDVIPSQIKNGYTKES